MQQKHLYTFTLSDCSYKSDVTNCQFLNGQGLIYTEHLIKLLRSLNKPSVCLQNGLQPWTDLERQRGRWLLSVNGPWQYWVCDVAKISGSRCRNHSVWTNTQSITKIHTLSFGYGFFLIVDIEIWQLQSYFFCKSYILKNFFFWVWRTIIKVKFIFKSMSLARKA